MTVYQNFIMRSTLIGNLNDFRDDAAVVKRQTPQRDRQFESFGAGAAGVDIDDAILIIYGRLMGMPEDHH